MNKFTPKKWEQLTFSNHELQTDFAMVRIGGRVHMVGYSQEDFANAMLIAAAPDLLDALSEIINDGGKFVMTHETHRKARAAIAKARGAE